MSLLPISLQFPPQLDIHQCALDACKIMLLIRKLGKETCFKPDYAEISGYALQLRRIIRSNLISESPKDTETMKHLAQLMDQAAQTMLMNFPGHSIRRFYIKILTDRITHNFLT